VAVLGVGNELNGDDAAGIIAVRILQQEGLAESQFLLLETGPSPENFTSPVNRFGPDWVIFIDAARMNQKPGQIVCFGMEDIEGASAFTHGLPLSLVGNFLVQESGCLVSLVGIQLDQTRFDSEPGRPVRAAAERVAEFLGDLLIQF
jgi:hydrogenase 3 maturation protease